MRQMEAKKQSNCVAVFERHDEVEAAIHELHASGFDMKKLSIIGRDYHTEEQAVGFYNAGDRVKHWGKFGAHPEWKRLNKLPKYKDTVSDHHGCYRYFRPCSCCRR